MPAQRHNLEKHQQRGKPGGNLGSERPLDSPSYRQQCTAGKICDHSMVDWVMLVMNMISGSNISATYAVGCMNGSLQIMQVNAALVAPTMHLY
jgi:hypothetical protein